MPSRLAIARNDAAPSDLTAVAAGLALNAEGGAPEWVQLLPQGPLVVGRDGRQFTVYDPAAIVAATIATTGLPMVLDFLHATELRPGDDNPAAGWIEELAVRDGSIWGRVAWTKRAANAVADREYRFLSPVFYHERTAEARILALVSAGLVHRPNLDLKALNHREPPRMDLAQLLAALGLPANTNEADALAAVRTLKADHVTALNAAQNPPLDRYVPASQHAETVRALNEANGRLATIDASARQTKAETLIDDAVKAGKVAPAARADFLTLALNSYDGTKKAIDAMPALVQGGESQTARAAEKAIGADQSAKLTPEQKAICARMGLSEEAYAKSLAA